MAETKFMGNAVHTNADLPQTGAAAPAFTVTGADLSDITLEGLKGRKVVLNVFPSLDTDVCAMSVRKFNELAAGLADTTVVCISADLPFAMGRFCSTQGIENVTVGSTFRSTFAEDYGVKTMDGPLAGLCARSVFVIDPEGKLIYSELVPETTQEPDYDKAMAALA